MNEIKISTSSDYGSLLVIVLAIACICGGVIYITDKSIANLTTLKELLSLRQKLQLQDSIATSTG